MNDAEAEALLRRASAKTSWGMGCVGAGTVGLGAFMVALHAADLDPDLRTMSLAGIVALYFFGGLFVAVGLLMAYVAIIKLPGQTSALVEAVLREPARVRRVYRQTVKTEGFENLPGGQHSVMVEIEGVGTLQLGAGLSPELADRVHDLVRSRAPHALGAP